jgi:uncharacterized cupin superfamily protein
MIISSARFGLENRDSGEPDAASFRTGKDRRRIPKLSGCDCGHRVWRDPAPFDALVQVLEGEAEITISGKTHHLEGGDLILMPAQQPHALKALRPYKMLLTMIRA